MKSLVYRAAATEGLLSRARQRVARRGATVLLYHDIGDDTEPQEAWQVLRSADFRAQVAYLRQHYEIVDIDSAWAWLRGDLELPRPPVVLTFDDGLRGNYLHLLPLVRELQIPVLVYIATEHIESQQGFWFDRIANALRGSRAYKLDLTAWQLGLFKVDQMPGKARWAQIQAVLGATKRIDQAVHHLVAQAVEQQTGVSGSSGPLLPMTLEMLQALAAEPLVTLGVHSHGHEVLTQLSPQQVRASLQACKDRLQQWTGREVRHMAYPSGFHCRQTREEVARMGFATAAGTEQVVWCRDHDIMQIPRFAVGGYDSLSQFKVNIVGGLRRALGL